MVCHTLLLSYFSSYFDAACFGRFIEATTNTIEMPEENPAEVRAFISWVYSGFLSNAKSGPQPERLWILADMLGAPEFSNDAMSLVCGKYLRQWLTPDMAELVYKSTRSTSELRRFIHFLIKAEGPLCDDYCHLPLKRTRQQPNNGRAEWMKLLSKGGDIITDNIERGFNTCPIQDDDEWYDIAPYIPANTEVYRVKEHDKSAETWREEELANDSGVVSSSTSTISGCKRRRGPGGIRI